MSDEGIKGNSIIVMSKDRPLMYGTQWSYKGGNNHYICSVMKTRVINYNNFNNSTLKKNHFP